MRRARRSPPTPAADRHERPGADAAVSDLALPPGVPDASTGPAAVASRRVINDWLKALRQRQHQARGALLRAAEQVPERHAGADGQHRAGADRGQHVAVVRRGGDRDGRRRRLHDRHLQAHQAPGRQLRHAAWAARRAAPSASSGARSRSGTGCPTSRAASSRRRRRRRVPRCERRRRALRRPRQPAGARRGPRRRRLRPRGRGRRRRRRRRGAAARRGPRPPGRRSTLPVRWVRGNADREVVAHFDRGDTDHAVYGADAPAERADAFTAARITRAHRDLMAGFEDVVRLDGALYCHGSPRSDEEIITAVTPESAPRADAGGGRRRRSWCAATPITSSSCARARSASSTPAAWGCPTRASRRLLAAGRRRRARAAAHGLRRRRRRCGPARQRLSRRRRPHPGEPARAGRRRPSSRATSRTRASRDLRRSAIGSLAASVNTGFRDVRDADICLGNSVPRGEPAGVPGPAPEVGDQAGARMPRPLYPQKRLKSPNWRSGRQATGGPRRMRSPALAARKPHRRRLAMAAALASGTTSVAGAGPLGGGGHQRDAGLVVAGADGDAGAVGRLGRPAGERRPRARRRRPRAGAARRAGSSGPRRWPRGRAR